MEIPIDSIISVKFNNANKHYMSGWQYDKHI